MMNTANTINKNKNTNNNEKIFGYKVFNLDWTCRDFQYEVGKTYELDGELKICENGFHYCDRLIDCFNYYSFNSYNKVALVEILGNIETKEDKSCTDKINIVKEISWYEVLDMVNTGKDNTGNRNTGNRNTGNWNTGNRNTGYGNTGNRNTGYRNTGNGNTGYRNTGNGNTGDLNKTNYSSGIFNTQEQTIVSFNKPCGLTLSDWWKSIAYSVLSNMPTDKLEWVDESDMTNLEKERKPSYKTTGGYLKMVKVGNDDKQEWWDNLSYEERKSVMSIPNFDKNIFKEVTGIDVGSETIDDVLNEVL